MKKIIKTYRNIKKKILVTSILMIFLASTGITAFQAVPGESGGKINNSPALAASDIGGTNGTEFVAGEEASYGNGTLPELESYGESSSEGMPPASNPASYEYPATCSFANDEAGYNPAGWIITESPDTDIQVVTSYKDSLNWTHGSVLLINNTDSTADSARNNFVSSQSFGTIELYCAFGEVSKNHAIKVINTDDDPAIEIVFNNDGHIRAKSGSTWKDARYGPLDYEANEFTHIHLEFECRPGGGYKDLRQNNVLAWYHYNLFVNTQLAFANFSMSATTGNMAAIEFSQSEINSVAYYDAIDYSWDSGHNNLTIDGASTPVETFEGFSVGDNVTTSGAWTAGSDNKVDGSTIYHKIASFGGSKVLRIMDVNTTARINITRVLECTVAAGQTIQFNIDIPSSSSDPTEMLTIILLEGNAKRIWLEISYYNCNIFSRDSTNTSINTGLPFFRETMQNITIKTVNATHYQIRVDSWNPATMANFANLSSRIDKIRFITATNNTGNSSLYIDNISVDDVTSARIGPVETFEGFSIGNDVIPSNGWTAGSDDNVDGSTIYHKIASLGGSKALRIVDVNTTARINITRALECTVAAGQTIHLDIDPVSSCTNEANVLGIILLARDALIIWLEITLHNGSIFSRDSSNASMNTGLNLTCDAVNCLTIKLVDATHHQIQVGSGNPASMENYATLHSKLIDIRFTTAVNNNGNSSVYIDNMSVNEDLQDGKVLHDITVTNGGSLTVTGNTTYLLVTGYVQVLTGSTLSLANGSTLDCRDGLNWGYTDDLEISTKEYLTKDISCEGTSIESKLLVDSATVYSDGIEGPTTAQIEIRHSIVHTVGFRFTYNIYANDPGEDLIITSSNITCDNVFHLMYLFGVAAMFNGSDMDPTTIDTPVLVLGSGQSYDHDASNTTLKKCSKVTFDHVNATGLLLIDYSHEITINHCEIPVLIMSEEIVTSDREFASITVTGSRIGLYSPSINQANNLTTLILRPCSGNDTQFTDDDAFSGFEIVKNESTGERAVFAWLDNTSTPKRWYGDFFEFNASISSDSKVDMQIPSAFAFGPRSATIGCKVKDCSTEETRLLGVGHVAIVNSTLSAIASEDPMGLYNVINSEFYNIKDLNWDDTPFNPDGLGWSGNASIHSYTLSNNASVQFTNCWFPSGFTAYYGAFAQPYNCYVNPGFFHDYVFVDTNFVPSETNIDFCMCTNPRFNCMIMNTTKGAPVSIDYFMFRKEHYSGFDIANGDFPGPGPVDCELVMPDNCYSSTFVVKVKNSTGDTIETVTVNAPSRTFTLDDMTTCDDFTISFSVTGDSTQYPVAGVLHNYFRDDFELYGSSWLYKRAITISPVTPAADYAVRIDLDSSFDFWSCRSDGGDLRFLDQGSTSLPYWIEQWNRGVNATIWVKVPTA
nr:DUF2341 domain-containing protein [Candidatus Sigynarchaeota archaeon]